MAISFSFAACGSDDDDNNDGGNGGGTNNGSPAAFVAGQYIGVDNIGGYDDVTLTVEYISDREVKVSTNKGNKKAVILRLDWFLPGDTKHVYGNDGSKGLIDYQVEDDGYNSINVTTMALGSMTVDQTMTFIGERVK